MSSVTRTLAILGTVSLPLLAPGQEPRASELATLQEKVQRAIARAEPSVACILVSRSDAYHQYGSKAADEAAGKLGRFHAGLAPFGRRDDEAHRRLVRLDLSHPDHVPESFGSGVVLDESGLVLTAAHVVRNATKLYVRLPGGRGSWADIHALDPRSDLAVLRLLDPVPDLKAVPLGDAGALRKGQFVISLANPFAAGFRDGSPSASWGIVSNLRRRARGAPDETDRSRQSFHHFGTLLETDVRLNLGCSGGTLLNLDGEMIGLTTAVAAVSGGETPAGYAIPLDANWRRIIDVLRRGEEVEYGFLGVRFQEQPHASHIIQVLNAIPGCPAQQAGLQGGDVIVSVDGVPVRDFDDLFLQVGIHLAGTPVRLEVLRGRPAMRHTFTVKLAKFHVSLPVIASKRPPARGGLRVDYTSTLTPQAMMGGPWVRGIPSGVVIREVEPGSAADRAQLQAGKVITRVNDQLVQSPDDYYRAALRSPSPMQLTILSGNGSEERVPLSIK